MTTLDALGVCVKAFAMGLAVAAPVGPMSLLCMRRTLANGPARGLATGFGIACGDGCYALVAAFGLAGVSRFTLSHERLLHAAAGLVLIALGIAALLRKAEIEAQVRPASSTSTLASFGSAFLLTLTNPPTIVTFAALFTALAPLAGFNPQVAFLTVAGVLAGSALWWMALVAAVVAARHALRPATRQWIDRVAALALALFGAFELRRGLSG